MLHDYKLGFRMLLKYPGLTGAGGLALAITIAIGAGWYDLTGKVLWPTIPLPDGDRIVSIHTRNIRTNELELRLAHDFLEWKRELRTIRDLGAYRPAPGNLIVGNSAPQRIQLAELTSAAFRTARVSPLLGRGLIDSDESPGAPGVVVLGYHLWQRSLDARTDIIGSEVKLGNTAVTVVGVMPEGFGYPFNYDAWTPLRLRASYDPLEGGVIGIIGRLAPGATRAQAEAELRGLGEQTAAALPSTHQHLRPQVTGLGELGDPDDMDVSAIAQLAITNLPVLLVLAIAWMSVGTLVYARTAIREGEIALRSALGASRAHIVGQLFAEVLVLASLAAVLGLAAADWALRWGIEGAYADEGGIPFWITPGLSMMTMLYAGGLAVASAATVSLVPALRATRARMQSHLANLGSGGATLRFGRVWTGAMIAQIALTAIGIPTAIESASQVIRNSRILAEFPSREYLVARIELARRFEEEASSALAERRAQMFTALERRMAEEPGVVAVAFADGVPGAGRSRTAQIELSPGAGPAFDYRFEKSAVSSGFFETFERPIIAGRAFHAGDNNPASRTVIVDEAFVRGFLRRGGSGSALGVRLRYSDAPADSGKESSREAGQGGNLEWFEIVGVVRDLGLSPDDEGNERPHVFHAASAGTVEPFVMSVRARDNQAVLAGRLPTIAGSVDPELYVQEARRLDGWINRSHMTQVVGAGFGTTALVLFLSALGIYSLMSVNVSRRTREIGLRVALGARPRHVLAGILRHAAIVMGSGVTLGAGALLLVLAQWEEKIAPFIGWLGVTAAVMLAATLLASIVPARRALRINPTDALRET